MKPSYTVFPSFLSQPFRFNPFFIGLVILFLTVFTLFQTGERVVKANREILINHESNKPNIESSGNAAAPLSAILNIDGTIKKGSIGSFDPKGFHMSYGPNGEPRFLPVDGPNDQRPDGGCSDGWDDRFGLPGTNGAVYASALDASGNLYIGAVLQRSVTCSLIESQNGTGQAGRP